MSRPAISIIIPVYNRAKLVGEAIESILAQTSPHWELIVVDDGSTDNTWSVLENYSKLDSRIKVLKRHGEPKGANRCRNQGAEKAKGAYLFFLDSDDLLGSGFVDTRENLIAANPEPEMIITLEGAFEKTPSEGYFFSRRLFDKEDDLVRFFKRDNPWLTSGPIIKKNSFDKVNGFNELLNSGQEWDLFVRILLGGISYKKVNNVDNVDVFKRMSPDIATISNRNTPEKRYFDNVNTFNSIMPVLKDSNKLKGNRVFRVLVVKYFFHYCAEIAGDGKNKLAVSFWKELYSHNLVGFCEWLYWRVYFEKLFFQTKIVKRIMESFILRFFPGSYFYR